ncbi:MAG: hypothetical protein A2528_01930 [Candidatus Staskawiczbacteria bacterium RIFOXYD2_FULL_37_9]|uniref:Uncharacterized protein n=1 Tax=Candidatus Staskawiczbacteria bacterium RIFOXYB1_FULL_37_44 TaxID=1802223 RepID=A0A1G2IUW5_9BACT|nr:MAG: hypothetical protein A2358_01725 [Candidatus Staskawiczbacteria bacterium RIFOXYB1_FULL_37_44]OGZ84582.1 MAG: hypothetical protein A2416_01690 [Candidatus Staskawiczbacteria bacterium RIFOXYC1_FULL_37_52]OGZ87628.1 MAG: hypothetical protein A2444_03710 [Candidatus Staskawiczbacteria bacterium RIFOXYC2_FULL_37_19]OGZ89832.1 MAG: hypothetical protein A2581_03940 [Candidatus Staskawiczbacteria bacterium RIFOXYD1_FULL_37_110]OGZ93931.1 MAG: hypothetical protein A2528_01930 [Candidatus Stask
MTDYISQGKGKIVRIKFPNLGHIINLEPLTMRLSLILRVMIVAINSGFEFNWNQQVYASDETVNRTLNDILVANPDAKISFS